MTGLDPTSDCIIEIATIVTDTELNILEEGPELVINQPAELFDGMDAWNRRQHTKSGLWDKVVRSDITTKQAEQETLEFVKKFVKKNEGILAGNSIWQDRRFLVQHMPTLDEYLFYRMIDVSTVKTLVTYWYPQKADFKKKNSHRALGDIKESIAELRHLRKTAFIPPGLSDPSD